MRSRALVPLTRHCCFRLTALRGEIGQIIVADVDHARIAELLEADRVLLGKLIRKEA